MIGQHLEKNSKNFILKPSHNEKYTLQTMNRPGYQKDNFDNIADRETKIFSMIFNIKYNDDWILTKLELR